MYIDLGPSGSTLTMLDYCEDDARATIREFFRRFPQARALDKVYVGSDRDDVLCVWQSCDAHIQRRMYDAWNAGSFIQGKLIWRFTLNPLAAGNQYMVPIGKRIPESIFCGVHYDVVHGPASFDSKILFRAYSDGALMFMPPAQFLESLDLSSATNVRPDLSALW